jgi:hypothetical protein
MSTNGRFIKEVVTNLGISIEHTGTHSLHRASRASWASTSTTVTLKSPIHPATA